MPDMSALYALLGTGGIIAIVLGVVFLATRASKWQGIAEEKARSEAEARHVEHEINDIAAKPREPGETEKRLDNGTF